MTTESELNRCTLEHMSTAVVVLDAELTVVAANPSAEELLAQSAKQAIGQSLTRLMPRAHAYARMIRRVLREGEALTARDLRLDLDEHQPVIVDCTVTPVVEPSTKAAVVIELRPLSEQKRISSEEHLVAQNESVRALLRGLAHEIRNPLGGLRGAAQLLERELDDASLAEYTQVIVNEADRLQDLMTRLMGPRVVARRRATNLHEVTERVYTLLRAESPEVIDIRRDYDPSIPEVRADPELIIQAVLNVARNAVQAVSDGGTVALVTRVRRQTTIGSRRHKLVASIDVVDDGPGVPEPLDEAIFYPMVTGRADGTGLGLYIAQSLVNQHGGLIEFERAFERTTFSILLPVGETDE